MKSTGIKHKNSNNELSTYYYKNIQGNSHTSNVKERNVTMKKQ
jgi:hypothetical protein